MAFPIRRVAVHEQVVNILRREIRTRYQPGDQLPPVRALVARFGVSLVSITQAMVALTAEGLVERRHGSGNYVRDTRTVKHVALLSELDVLHPDTSRFFPFILSELRQQLATAGVPCRLYLGRQRPGEPPVFTAVPELLQAVTAGTVSAVVALHSAVDGSPWLAEVTAAGVPVIGDLPGYAYSVIPDVDDMITQAVDCLLAQGCERLGLLSWSPRPEDAPLGERPPNGPVVDAFQQALARHDARFNPAWCRGDIHPSLRGAGWSEFREMWSTSRQKPDGVLVADDMLLPDAVQAIRELRLRVPEQLRLASHVNLGCSAAVELPLTRLEYDPVAHAQAIFDMLKRLLAGDPVPSPRVLIPHRLLMPPVVPTASAMSPAALAIR